MDLFRIGKISGTHHLKGTVKVTSNFADEEILKGNKGIIEFPNGSKKLLTIIEVKRINGKILTIDFEEIVTKSEGQSLQNGVLFVRRDLLGEISEDEFYNEDLIDFEVINSNDEILGLLIDIMETGAHDIYIVGEDEIMIPNVDEYVKKIDFENKKIYVDVPQDLIDLNK
jgi:16S rRNA processing protein RimM